MRVERRPYDFDIDAESPNARLFKAWEGGGAFKAERDGKHFIISDGLTLAEFLDMLNLATREFRGALDPAQEPTHAHRTALRRRFSRTKAPP